MLLPHSNRYAMGKAAAMAIISPRMAIMGGFPMKSSKCTAAKTPLRPNQPDGRSEPLPSADLQKCSHEIKSLRQVRSRRWHRTKSTTNRSSRVICTPVAKEKSRKEHLHDYRNDDCRQHYTQNCKFRIQPLVKRGGGSARRKTFRERSCQD